MITRLVFAAIDAEIKKPIQDTIRWIILRIQTMGISCYFFQMQSIRKNMICFYLAKIRM